jgi:hypothetical protein
MTCKNHFRVRVLVLISNLWTITRDSLAVIASKSFGSLSIGGRSHRALEISACWRFKMIRLKNVGRYLWGKRQASPKKVLTIPSLVMTKAGFVKTQFFPQIFSWNGCICWNFNSTLETSYHMYICLGSDPEPDFGNFCLQPEGSEHGSARSS